MNTNQESLKNIPWKQIIKINKPTEKKDTQNSFQECIFLNVISD